MLPYVVEATLIGLFTFAVAGGVGRLLRRLIPVVTGAPKGQEVSGPTESWARRPEVQSGAVSAARPLAVPAVVTDPAIAADPDQVDLLAAEEDGKLEPVQALSSEARPPQARITVPVAVEAADKMFELESIAGIDRSTAARLFRLGIKQVDQVANWGSGHVRWVERHLQLDGRIESNDWVGQARAITEGPVKSQPAPEVRRKPGKRGPTVRRRSPRVRGPE